ncbi:LysR family transcriptional regulator [Mailhella sp.]|uniref:LysR family transcriptional regulator n=1 Tax=Mailhella sp. TaxID=1981029 RepID=UPI0040633F87
MDSHLLKYQAFLKTVELGSFTKAGKALFRSQSGISRMIDDLEREWGVVLLERGRSGVNLTSDGVHLLPFVRNVCEAQLRLREQVDELNGLHSGLIRIGTFSSAATHWLPRIVREFRKDYPGIDYEFLLGDYSEIENWLFEGRVDCGFLRLPVSPGLESRFLERDELVAVLPLEHTLARSGKEVPIAEMAKEPFMLLEKGDRSEISLLFEAHDLESRVCFTTWDDYAVMSMVENGLGVSILPRLILRRIPYRIAIRSLDVPAFRDIGLVYSQSRPLSPSARRFLDYVSYR